MTRFVKNPNLPEDCKTVIICDKYCDKLAEGLKTLKIEAIRMPEHPLLPGSVSSHTDLSVFHGGEKVLYLSGHLKNTNFAVELEKLGAELHYYTTELRPEYPGDVPGNICYFGNTCILNPDTSDPAITGFLIEKEIQLIPVRQGYAKCSVCIVDEDSIITADPGIAKKAEKAGIDVLQIDPGHIRLDGFAYGFLGGAAFKVSRSVLCFTGILDAYPPADKEQILAFLEKKNVRPYYLTDLPAFDIGGAVPLIER
jgi:hypothetical protein